MIGPRPRPTRFDRVGRRSAAALLLLLVFIASTAATDPWERLMSHGSAVKLAGHIFTRSVSLTPLFISPGTSPGVQDSAVLDFTIATADTLFIAVALDSTNGRAVDGALLASYRPVFDSANVRKTVSINGTFHFRGEDITLDDGQYDVVLRVVAFTSAVGDSIEEDRIRLTIDRLRPVLTGLTNANPKPSYKNGDTIVIDAHLDQPGYTVIADFTQLDSDHSTAATQVADNGNGSYTIRHTLSEDNALTDGNNLTVPLTFLDKAGNSLRDASLNFCLLNNAPRISSVKFLNPTESSTFRNGDTLVVETHWLPLDTPITLTVAPNAWNLDSAFRPEHLAIQTQANNIFVLTYVISDSNRSPDGDYCLKIRGDTGGCGTITDQTKICATLDNHRIANLIVNSFPSTTRDSLFTITGRAAGALNVSFKRGGTHLITVPVDSLGNFTAHVPLIDGLNTILVESFDPVLSAGPDTTITVTRVTRAFLVLPVRIKPETVIRVAPTRTAASLRIEFWNLAGELVATLEDVHRSDLYEVAWNGRTASGELVRTGPLICRVDAHLVDGTHELTDRAILFSPR